MRPSFFGFETGEPRKFRNLPDEKIGMGRTKRQNIGYFCPAEKVCAGCTVRIGRFLNLLCGGGSDSVRTGWRSFAPERSDMRLWPSVAAAGTNPQTGSVSGGALPGDTRYFQY